MRSLNLGQALREALQVDPAFIPDIVARAASGIGATDVVVYLVDFAQKTLEPLPDQYDHGGLPEEEVGVTMAGRAFLGRHPTVAERPEGVRVWVPVVEGSDRTGVLALTVSQAEPEVIGACEELGILTGYLIASHARVTDIYTRHRSREAMSLAASIQWDHLPPLVLRTGRVAVAGLLEPAYEVGGDSFDYAINGPFFDMAIFDAMGHGLTSALVSSAAIGSYRHDRRRGHALGRIHFNLDATLSPLFDQGAFATGQLVRIELDTGRMSWTNAGHPLPLLIRAGQVVGELVCAPTPPWGYGSLLGGGTAPPLATEALEPSDDILFYTDGVIEARTPRGARFGIDRLADLATQHSSEHLEPEEIVRHLIRSVIEHQSDHLADDASLVVARWQGPGPKP
ncbi:MAG: PP2C family protein-serine/threonine phosphatase [Acidimicrobiales bacterium]